MESYAIVLSIVTSISIGLCIYLYNENNRYRAINKVLEIRFNQLDKLNRDLIDYINGTNASKSAMMEFSMSMGEINRANTRYN